MGDNVDVKALTARFRQPGMMPGGGGGPGGLGGGGRGGGGPVRLPSPMLDRGAQSPADFGSVRPRFPPHSNKPAFGGHGGGLVSPPSNGPRFGSAPHGVFPRPPPSHRPTPTGTQEAFRPPFTEDNQPGRGAGPGPGSPFRPLPGDRGMPKPHSPAGGLRSPPQVAVNTPPLSRMKRSTSSNEVVPLLRPLPTVGPRPNKPKRPPYVNLEHFRKNPGIPPTPTARLSGRMSEGSSSPIVGRTMGLPLTPSRMSEGSNSPIVGRTMGLPLPPVANNKQVTKPVPNHNVHDDQDTYDDIDALPPPPLDPPTQENFSPSLSRPPDIRSPPFMPVKPSAQPLPVVNDDDDDDDDDDQDMYDDIDALNLPPPPPPPTSQSQDSWEQHSSSQAEEWDDDSDGSEIYEEVDQESLCSQEKRPARDDPRKQTKKDIKRQQEQERKEQKEREKKESALRKKFKLTGNETPLHMARVRVAWQGGKNDLVVQQGDSVEIIRTEGNPEGRWLGRTMDGTYGYISTKCLDMDYEEVKRRFANLGNPRPHDPGLYDDVDSAEALGNDDSRFPPPPPDISPHPKMLKKIEKEEKEFRKKFKFEGPIQVLQYMRVDPNGNIKKAGAAYLNVHRGETVEVIQFTNDKKALCRNAQGKYGYVSMAYLLQEEPDIYDDVDHAGDVYDN
ncbi:FYN-binding protein 1 isoform X2 [Engraulis encrasicolus]|uniref:FYN-binding protein 1 isoform X2 n=1 Tax=Engraulis encrasicolus TaxID=184585 RepID=UPI002FD67EA4